MMEIYCGNLSFSVDDQQLREAFEPFGTIESAVVVIDKFSGKSRGFGFVKMPDSAEATTAIAALDGQKLAQRKIRVSTGRPQRDFGDKG